MPIAATIGGSNNVEASTTQTTLQTPSSTVLPSIPARSKYFVIATANLGGNDAACESAGTVRADLNDANELASGAGEGSGNDHGYASFHLQTAFIIDNTANASDSSVGFRYRCITSNDTTFINAQSILGIPLVQPPVAGFQDGIVLAPNIDYFYSGTDSSSAELSNISNTWTTLRTVDFTMAVAGNYFYAFSCESWMTTGVSASDAHEVRVQIDGTTQGAGEYVREWETDNDRFMFLYTDVANLTAGSHTFRIQIKNRAANATLNAGRSRIFALRGAAFTQMVQTVDTSGKSFTNTTYDATNVFLTTSLTQHYDCSQSIIACSNFASSINGAALSTLRQVGGGAGGTDAGETPNNSGLGSDDDFWPRVMVSGTGSNGAGVAHSWQVELRMESAGTGTAGKNAGNTAGVRSNLVVIEDFVPSVDPIVLSEAGGIVPFHR